MLSIGIENDSYEVGTAKKPLKIRTLTGAYLRHCNDVFEVGIADTVLKYKAKCCILPQFERMFWKLEPLRK